MPAARRRLALAVLLALPAAARATDFADAIIQIGVVGTIFGFTAVTVGLVSYWTYRARRLHHETIRLAMERGQPLPAALSTDAERTSPPRDLRRGLLLIGLGVGLSLSLHFTNFPGMPSRDWAIGLVPGFLGLAYLAAFFLSRRLAPRDDAER